MKSDRKGSCEAAKASDQSEPPVIRIHAEEAQTSAEISILAGKLPVELLK